MPQTFLPGDPTVYPSDALATTFSAVFEDDGETGYVYACDRAARGGEGEILDACHLYSVRSITDREIPSEVEVVWTTDGLRAALLLNGYPHAIIDFAARIAYCRSNWPPPTGPWAAVRADRAPWREDVLTGFTALEA